MARFIGRAAPEALRSEHQAGLARTGPLEPQFQLKDQIALDCLRTDRHQAIIAQIDHLTEKLVGIDVSDLDAFVRQFTGKVTSFAHASDYFVCGGCWPLLRSLTGRFHRTLQGVFNCNQSSLNKMAPWLGQHPGLAGAQHTSQFQQTFDFRSDACLIDEHAGKGKRT